MLAAETRTEFGPKIPAKDTGDKSRAGSIVSIAANPPTRIHSIPPRLRAAAAAAAAGGGHQDVGAVEAGSPNDMHTPRSVSSYGVVESAAIAP